VPRAVNTVRLEEDRLQAVLPPLSWNVSRLRLPE